MPYIPLNAAGRIVLPPVCAAQPRSAPVLPFCDVYGLLPSAIGTWKSATTAPEPEELPPAVLVGSLGLQVGGPF